MSDKANNVAIMDRKIDYKKIINLFEYTIVLRFYGIIDISLNDDFNSNLKILKENNSFLSDISMSFNNESGIVCESTIETNHISFLFDVYYYDFNGIKINISSNSNIINNIIYSNVGLYYVQFQSFETTNFFSVVNVLNFEIVDTKPPVLTFIENSNFSDITNLDLSYLLKYSLEDYTIPIFDKSIGYSKTGAICSGAIDNNLYVLTASLTLTLPASPEAGDSIKISNRSSTTTCVIGRNGNNIMGSASNLTLDTASASFELIYADATHGWVIIGQ